MTSERNRYVYALVGAPCAVPEPSSSHAAPDRVVTRVSIDLDDQEKSLEERAASYLAGVGHDLVTMREFFGRGQDIEELFSYNYVDAQGKQWLREQLRLAFARIDVHAFFLYYTGHSYRSDGAWYLGEGDNRLSPGELFALWQESPSGQSGESVLIIISDSCHSGQWVEAAKQAQLKTVSVQQLLT